MKRIKVVFLVFFLAMLSGCSVQYNLEFKDYKLTEQIHIVLEGLDYRTDKIDYLKNFKFLAISKGRDQVEYQKNFNDQNGKFVASYNYEYKIEDFYKNNVLNHCYDSFSLVEDNDYYLLSTGKTFNCLSVEYQPVDEYVINITTNHKVLEHNADKVSNNKYSWIIDNNDNEAYATKPIMIKFSKEIDKGILDNAAVTIIAILVTILIIGGIIFLIAYYKNKQANKM